MYRVHLGIGSNIEPERHVRIAIAALGEWFGRVALSSVYRSGAVGFDGPPFLNLVAAVDTDWPLAQLAARLKQLEYSHGRVAGSGKHRSLTLDVDILSVGPLLGCFDGVELPRPEIFHHAHVLCPFAEVAPELVLPGQTLSLAALWRRFDRPTHGLMAVTSWPIPAPCYDSAGPAATLATAVASRNPLGHLHVIATGSLRSPP